MVDGGSELRNSYQNAILDVGDKSYLEQINRYKITALFVSRKRVSNDFDASKF